MHAHIKEADLFLSFVLDFGSLGLAILFLFWGKDELDSAVPWNPAVIEYSVQQACYKWLLALGLSVYSAFGEFLLYPKTRWAAVAVAVIAFILLVKYARKLPPAEVPD